MDVDRGTPRGGRCDEWELDSRRPGAGASAAAGGRAGFLRVLRQAPGERAEAEEPAGRQGAVSLDTSAAVGRIMADLGMNVEQFMDIFLYAQDRFDLDGDGSISQEEFYAACGLLGLKVRLEDAKVLFNFLAAGKDHWAPSELYQVQKLQKAVQGAVAARYEDSGLQSLGVILESMRDSMTTGSLLERLRSLASVLEGRSGKLLDVFETGVNIVATGCAGLSLVNALTDGDGMDFASIAPLLLLLWKTGSDTQQIISDSLTTDLCQDHARVFATIFKPAGFTLPSFKRLCTEADAKWISIPKGSEIPPECGGKLKVIGSGRVKTMQKSALPGLQETSATLGPGTFTDHKALLSSEKLCSERSRHVMVAVEETLVLELDVRKLQRYIKVDASANQAIHCALARSQVATTAQLNKQSRRIASELPLLFKDLAISAASQFHADRATFWIHNAADSLLWTLFVAEDGSCTYVAIDQHSGLAGHCFSQGETINIPDCYQNTLFNQEVDRTTGYYTGSMLCVPITEDAPSKNKDSQVIGVLQLINKLPNSSVGESHANMLAQTTFSAFTPQDEKMAEESMNLAALYVRQMASRYSSDCKRM